LRFSIDNTSAVGDAEKDHDLPDIEIVVPGGSVEPA
jgi:hypothetical protein